MVNDSLEWLLQLFHDSLRHRPLVTKERREARVCQLSDHMYRAGFLLLGFVTEAAGCLMKYVFLPCRLENDVSQLPLRSEQCVIRRSDVWQLPGNFFIGQFSGAVSLTPTPPLLNCPFFFPTV